MSQVTAHEAWCGDVNTDIDHLLLTKHLFSEGDEIYKVWEA